MDAQARRSRYEEIRSALPELFDNPSGTPIEIITDPDEIPLIEREAEELLESRGLPRKWGQLGVVFEDQFGITLRDAVQDSHGRRSTYSRRINPGNAPGVVIMPVHRDGIVLIRHFRHSTRTWHLEFPRGFGTPGERPDDDARRELLEEIGAEADTLTPLGYIYPDTGQAATRVHLYHAEVGHYRVADVEEGIDSVHAVSPAHLADLIRADATTGPTITDGFTIAAYTRALLRGLLPPMPCTTEGAVTGHLPHDLA